MDLYSGRIQADGVLTGTLSAVSALSGSISVAQTTPDIIVSEYPDYSGEYTVIPDPSQDQVLNTKNKTLRNDLEIKKIPYFETGNPQGGKTIIIGDKDYA